MTNPPQDALDLYAWGVEYCERWGIPLGAIRVRWTASKEDSHGFPCWRFEQDPDLDPVPRWKGGYMNLHLSYPLQYPPGFYLSFPSAGDAECYGLTGVVPFEGSDTCYVWVQPGHEFEFADWEYYGDAILTNVVCKCCNLRTQFNYGHKSTVPQEAYDKKEPVPVPHHIQLPACIKRHKPVIMDRGRKADSLLLYHACALCVDCRKQLPLPPIQKVSAGDFFSQVPILDVNNAVWLKSLGRCPGAHE